MQFLKRMSRLFLMIYLIAGTLFLTACQNEVQKEETKEVLNDLEYELSENDKKTNYQEAEKIELTQQKGDLILTDGGEYLISGKLDGSILVDVKDENIHLFFDGIDVQSKRGPAISVLSAGKVFITIVENTENIIQDSPIYDTEKEENACIYSRCDMTINGKGQLFVSGLYKDAIHCKDILKILCSSVSIQAKRDGLRGSDGVFVDSDDILIETEGNGIRTTKTGKGNKGTIEIMGDSVSIISGKYCLNSASNLSIHDTNCFLKGILGNTLVVGKTNIEEGCLQNESL